MLDKEFIRTIFGQKSTPSHETDDICLSCFLNVMGCNNDSDSLSLSEGYQVMPDALSQKGVNSNSGLIEDEQGWSMDKGCCERNPSLLSSTLNGILMMIMRKIIVFLI